MSITHVSITDEQGNQQVVGRAAFRVLESFSGNVEDERIEQLARARLERALADYPELIGETVTIARLSPDDDETLNARAGMFNRLVYLRTDRETTYMTMYHELSHLAIQVRRENDVDVPPTSERFCSIDAVTRMPPDVLDEDRIPYLGAPGIPREEWADACQRALAYRDKRGRNSHYVQHCLDLLEIQDGEPQ